MKLWQFGFVFMLAVPSLLSCSSTQSCVPGSTNACLGAGRCEGVQICNEDGNAFGTCVCDSADGGIADGGGDDARTVDAGDASTSDAPADSLGRDSGEGTHIVLSTRMAFPAAFGAGRGVSGGAAGTNYYAVTNTNDGGPGSFRDALDQGNDTVIIIQVEGLVSLRSAISGSSPDNITIWGQLAPGRGLTISDERITFERANGWIVRHLTFQNSEGDPNRSAVAWRTPDDGLGHYIDHVSARWGSDQTLYVGHLFPSQRSTIAHCFIGQGDPSHNTGSIIGSGAAGANDDAGDVTFARNVYVSVSHRTPNLGGAMNVEHYNNYIVNHNSRLSAVRGDIVIDWFHNYVERGNAAPSACSSCVNKTEDPVDGMRTYTGFNYVEGVEETPSDNQTTLWVNRNNREGPNNAPIMAFHYVSSRQHDFGAPADGIWPWSEVKARALAEAGHNRGINEDGSPGYFRDDVDEDFASRAETGTTRSTRLATDEFYDSTFPGTRMYPESSGDFIPDWFKNQHEHLMVGVDQRDDVHVEWDFGAYTVTNDAGYTNLEMAAAYYAGDFEILARGAE